jgi:hypothetical protein
LGGNSEPLIAAGGNWWDKQHTQKANAGPVILSLMPHFPTDRSYSAFTKKVYHYWLEHMVNPSTYQVADHLTTSGGQVWWKFTYNGSALPKLPRSSANHPPATTHHHVQREEGLMIGASVYMHAATQNATYLSIAQRIASFVLASTWRQSLLLLWPLRHRLINTCFFRSNCGQMR